ncbi:MAG: hypothetical protein ABIF12_00295 [bacterium]
MIKKRIITSLLIFLGMFQISSAMKNKETEETKTKIGVFLPKTEGLYPQGKKLLTRTNFRRENPDFIKLIKYTTNIMSQLNLLPKFKDNQIQGNIEYIETTNESPYSIEVNNYIISFYQENGGKEFGRTALLGEPRAYNPLAGKINGAIDKLDHVIVFEARKKFENLNRFKELPNDNKDKIIYLKKDISEEDTSEEDTIEKIEEL